MDVQVKLRNPLRTYLSASEMMIHEEASYQVYVPLHSLFPLPAGSGLEANSVFNDIAAPRKIFLAARLVTRYVTIDKELLHLTIGVAQNHLSHVME